MSNALDRNQNHQRPMFCFVSVLIFATFTCASRGCVHFSFPTLPSNHRLRAVVGSTISVPFKLDTRQCPAGWNQSYYVYAKKPQGDDYCAVRLKPEGCVSINKGRCPCLDGGPLTTVLQWSRKSLQQTVGLGCGERGRDSREEIILDVQGQTEEDNDIGKKDDEDDDEKDGFVDSSMKTGLVVGGANIVTFIFIALVVFLCRRKRERRGRRPSEKLPPLPTEVKGEVVTPSQRLANDVGSSTTLGHYEEIPAPFDNDTYLQPMVIVNTEESSLHSPRVILSPSYTKTVTGGETFCQELLAIVLLNFSSFESF